MSRHLFSFLVLACAWAVPVLIRADSRAAAPAKDASANPLDLLKQGDPAAKLKELLGEPLDTKPMKAPSGRAEVWIYAKEISRRLDRIDRSTTDVVISVTEADGSVRQKVTPGQIRFEDVQYVTEDVTEVLLFNGRYLLHKTNRIERKL